MNPLIIISSIKGCLLGIVAILFSSPLLAQATFDQRAATHIDWISGVTPNGQKQAFFTASAKFKKYETSGDVAYRDAARADVALGLKGIREDGATDNDIAFALWAAVDCYLRWSNYYTDDLKTDANNTLTGTTLWNKHNTSNKNMMAAAGRYLAEQIWPNASFSDYTSDDPSARQFILDITERYVTRGEFERNSTTYYMFHYGGLRTLADFAAEPDIRQQAYLTAEWMLAASCAEWLQGHWAAATKRSTLNPSHPQYAYAPGDFMMYLYFGGVAPKKNSSFGIPSTLVAVSNYRMPRVFSDIANHKEATGFIIKEKKDNYQGTYYGQTFKKPTYAVYSEIRSFTDGPLEVKFKNQNEPWGICWTTSDPTERSIFTIKNPFKYDGIEASNPDWGVSQYGQILQHENTVVAVYDIADEYDVNYLKGYVPTGYQAVIDNSSSGQVYFHYGDLLIGLHMTKGFTWNNVNPPVDTFNVFGRKVGFVVEVADSEKYSGTDIEKLQAFKSEVLPKFQAATFNTNGAIALRYTNLSGVTLDTKYNTYHKINGEDVDLANWNILENPFMLQRTNSSQLVVDFEGTQRIYDFSNWTITSGEDALPAEAATVGGGATIETTHSSYYGSGYVNFDTNGSFVEWRNVDGGPGGAAQLTFRYALQDGNRTGALLINGVSQDLTMTGTGAWTNYQTVTVTTSLNAGTNNVIRLESTGQDFGNVDQLLVQASESVEVSTYLEAEDGIINAPMRVANDANASEGQYVWVPNGEGNGGGGYTELSFAVPVAGNYSIHGRVIAPTTQDNSFSVSVDGGADYTWSIPGNPTSWVWHEINSYTLGAGTHTISVKQREDGTKLDQLWITSEPSTSPSARSTTEDNKHGEVPILTTDPGFRTYPNPASEQLTVEGSEDYQITLYDLTGRKVMQRDQLSGKATLNVSGLRPGLYLLKLRDDKQHELRRRILVE